MSTKEEDLQILRNELKEAQAKASKDKKDLEKELQELRNKLKDTEKKLQDSENTVAEQKELLLAFGLTLEAVCGIYLQTQKERLNHKKDIPDAELDILEEDIDRFRHTDQAFSNVSRLVHYVLSKGSEKTDKALVAKKGKQPKPKNPKPKKEKGTPSEDVEESIEERYDSNKEFERQTKTLLDPIREGVVIVSQEDEQSKDSLVNASFQIVTHENPKKIEKEGAPLKGRLIPKMEIEANKKVEQLSSTIQETENYCKKCGTRMEYKGSVLQSCRTLTAQLNSLIEYVSSALALYQCPNCGQMHVDVPEGVQTPVTPNNGKVSNALAVACGIAQTYGISMHRMETVLTSNGRNYQFGKETLMNNTNYLVDKGPGALLYEGMEKEAGRYEVLIMDETPFDILQQAGKSRKKIQASSRQAYILAVTAGPLEAHPITLYYRLESRSAESIKKVAGQFHPNVVITDGYKAYPSVLKAMMNDPDNPVGHQVCLVHWRRTLLDMVRVNVLSEVVLGPDGAEAAGRHIAQHDPEYLACVIIDGLRKIYGFEGELAREAPNGETLPERIARIEACRKKHAQPLMDHIDLIVKELAGRYAQFDRGRWMKKGDSLIGNAVVYYMNNRERIRLFLTDGRLSPDSNACERSIRAVVLYKRAARFKQSQGHTDSLCRWLTIVETGIQCGVKDLHKWLSSLAEAFTRHCWDETLTAQVDPDTRELKSCYIQEYTPEAKASFDITPWLPWNYARTESEAFSEPAAAPAGAEAPLS